MRPGHSRAVNRVAPSRGGGSRGVDGCAGRSACRGEAGSADGRETDLHHVDDAGVHDDGLGGEPAQRADDGGLRPDVRVPVSGAGDHLPAAAVAGRRRVGVRLDGRRVSLGERGPFPALGPVGGLVPVRDDDLLLPDVAGVRREHAGLHLQPRPCGQRRLHGHRDRGGVLARRVPVGTRRHRRDRQARVERAADRDADPGRGPGHPRHRLPAAGQHVGGADGREPPDPAVDRDREPGADRQQLPLLLGDGDERRARRVAEEPQEGVPAGDVLRVRAGAADLHPAGAGDQLGDPGGPAEPDRRRDAGVRRVLRLLQPADCWCRSWRSRWCARRRAGC